jgi:hypothetical protein
MEPLFLAVIYGCQAGLFRDTLHEVCHEVLSVDLRLRKFPPTPLFEKGGQSGEQRPSHSKDVSSKGSIAPLDARQMKISFSFLRKRAYI